KTYHQFMLYCTYREINRARLLQIFGLQAHQILLHRFGTDSAIAAMDNRGFIPALKLTVRCSSTVIPGMGWIWRIILSMLEFQGIDTLTRAQQHRYCS